MCPIYAEDNSNSAFGLATIAATGNTCRNPGFSLPHHVAALASLVLVHIKHAGQILQQDYTQHSQASNISLWS